MLLKITVPVLGYQNNQTETLPVHFSKPYCFGEDGSIQLQRITQQSIILTLNTPARVLITCQEIPLQYHSALLTLPGLAYLKSIFYFFIFFFQSRVNICFTSTADVQKTQISISLTLCSISGKHRGQIPD